MAKIFANVGKMVIKRTDAKTETPGGIILPPDAVNKVFSGIVVSVGNSNSITRECNGAVFKSGDFVVFAEYSGTEIEVDGEKLLVVDVEDVLVKVEN